LRVFIEWRLGVTFDLELTSRDERRFNPCVIERAAKVLMRLPHANAPDLATWGDVELRGCAPDPVSGRGCEAISDRDHRLLCPGTLDLIGKLCDTLVALLPTFLCSASCEVLRHAVIHLNQALHDSVGPTQCAVLLMLLQDGNKFVCEALQSLGDCFNSTDRVVGRRVTVGED